MISYLVNAYNIIVDSSKLLNIIIRLNENLLAFWEYEYLEKDDVIPNILFYTGDNFNFFNLFNKNDIIFDSLIINGNYLLEITDKYINDNLRLQKSYSQRPKCILKNNLILNDEFWNFAHIFNKYFCFCKDINSLKFKNLQKCKYYFYLYLIDNNRNVYSKTDFLFIDFVFNELTSDDAFPIFKFNGKLQYI